MIKLDTVFPANSRIKSRITLPTSVPMTTKQHREKSPVRVCWLSYYQRRLYSRTFSIRLIKHFWAFNKKKNKKTCQCVKLLLVVSDWEDIFGLLGNCKYRFYSQHPWPVETQANIGQNAENSITGSTIKVREIFTSPSTSKLDVSSVCQTRQQTSTNVGFDLCGSESKHKYYLRLQYKQKSQMTIQCPDKPTSV